MRFTLALAAAALAFGAAAADKVPTPPAGNYYLWLGPNPTSKQRLAVVNFDAAGAVKSVASGPNVPPGKLGELTSKDGRLVLPIDFSGTKFTFEAGPGPVDKGLLGSLGNDERVFRAGLEPTDKDAIAPADAVVRDKPDPAVAAAAKPLAEANNLTRKALREQDPAEKTKLKAQADDLRKKSEAGLVAALRKVFEAKAEGFAAAAEGLVGQAEKLPAEEVRAYAQAVTDDAKRYGARYEASVATRLASTLSAAGPPEVALVYAKRAADAPGLTAANRARALKILAPLQTKLGQAAEASATQGALDKIETVIDAEYKKTVPPFKPEPFAGRKDKAADRVAVLELFTGAECPPCVAADVAFDALVQSYPARDVVLLQYHLHIPGPDPLTNPDSIARFDFYSKLNESGFGGTPAAAFDGKAAAGGGGPMGNSKPKYDEFAELLAKSLADKASATVTATAKLAGDDLTATVEVAVKEPSDAIKLRLVLAEDEVKYVGGNGLRFHHHVVRGFVGTVAGVPVKSLPGGKYELKASVKGVREQLAKYLADYEGGFPNADRPLDLKALKLFALVQNDETGAILQAKEIELAGSK